MDKTPSCHSTGDFETSFENRTSVNARSDILEQQQAVGKGGFPENTKTDNQTLATNLSTSSSSSSDIKTEKSLPAPKLPPSEGDKELSKNTDTSTDNSDTEAKGKETFCSSHLQHAAIEQAGQTSSQDCWN
ncbi:hypothetical protein XELAEV_18002974mg [Xenopus laevis]|uniref:Uncharacterized protein n=1 Tax=Xenopus laevis TaxID=8355 RepID=A0A974GY92_XENLA|nr:hypothetical protein XELAEV_18002974mg [Xenopus laevis]